MPKNKCELVKNDYRMIMYVKHAKGNAATGCLDLESYPISDNFQAVETVGCSQTFQSPNLRCSGSSKAVTASADRRRQSQRQRLARH